MDSTAVPSTEWDPFSFRGLTLKDDSDRVLLETGEVVWLSAHSLWAVARYDLVEQILRDPVTFESSSGTGLTNVKKSENWRKPSVILENDPPEHGTYRRVMASVLSARVVRRLTESFQASADRLVADVIARGTFDAARDLAEAYPMSVLPDALGFAKDSRQHLLPYSSLNFNAAGPRNEFYRQAVKAAEGATEFVQWQMRREALDAAGLGTIIFDAADRGEISEDDAQMLVRTFLSAGLDTTIHGIQNTLKALVDTPSAWEALRADPGLARTVFEESLRCYAPSPYLARTTTREVQMGGVTIGAAEKVLLGVGAANRDPRRWERPDEFDITRDTSGHLAFGTGIHGCVGQMMARMEATCLLTAIAEQVESLELIGEPVIMYNNWLRGWDSLPMRVTAKLDRDGVTAPSISAPAYVAGELEPRLILSVQEREVVAEDVVSLVLVHPEGADLPAWAPGDHIDLVLDRPGAEQLVRQYSLCGDVDDRSSYRVAVLRDPDGDGASLWIHDRLEAGTAISVSEPRTTFPFEPSRKYLFVAGGIGITPLIPMMAAAIVAGAEWRLDYAGRRRDRMAFADDLVAIGGDRVFLHPRDESPLELADLIRVVDSETAIYACGPERLLAGLETAMEGVSGQLHVERFENMNELFRDGDRNFEVDLTLSGRTLHVEPGCSILKTLADAGIKVPSSCKEGTCGTCETFVVAGEVDHRDAILTATEKQESEVMMICVSRAKGDRLVLEI